MTMLTSLKALLFATPIAKGMKVDAAMTGEAGDFAHLFNSVGTAPAGQSAGVPADTGVIEAAAPAIEAEHLGKGDPALPVPAATQLWAPTLQSATGITQAAPVEPVIIVAPDVAAVDGAEPAARATEADVGHSTPVTTQVQVASVPIATVSHDAPVGWSDPVFAPSAHLHGEEAVQSAASPADDSRKLPKSSDSPASPAVIPQGETAAPSDVASAPLPQEVAQAVAPPTITYIASASDVEGTVPSIADAEPVPARVAVRPVSRPAGSHDVRADSHVVLSPDVETSEPQDGKVPTDRREDLSPAFSDDVLHAAQSTEFPTMPQPIPAPSPVVVAQQETGEPATFRVPSDHGLNPIVAAPMAADKPVATNAAVPPPIVTTAAVSRDMPMASTAVAPEAGNRPQDVASVSEIASGPVNLTAAPVRVVAADGGCPVLPATGADPADRPADDVHQPTPAIMAQAAPPAAPVVPPRPMALPPAADVAAATALPRDARRGFGGFPQPRVTPAPPISDAAAAIAPPQDAQSIPLQAADLPQERATLPVAASPRAEAVSLLQLVREHMNVRTPRRMEPEVTAVSLPLAAPDAPQEVNLARVPAAPNESVPPIAPSLQTIAQPLAAAAVVIPVVDLSASLGAQVVDIGISGQWIDGLARDIAGLSAHGAQGRFQINADQLGPIQVDIRQSDDGTAVSLTVATEAAEMALRQEGDRLKLDAGLASVRISDVKIERAPHVAETARADSSGNQNNAQQQPNGQGQTAGQGMGQSSTQSHMHGRGQQRENFPSGHKAGNDAAVLNHMDGGDSADGAVRARYA